MNIKHSQSSIYLDEVQHVNIRSMPVSIKENFVKRLDHGMSKDIVLSYFTSLEDSTSDRPKLDETISIKGRGIRPEILIKRKREAIDKFVMLQSWEGIVTKVGESSFFARLYDLTNKGNEEEVELSLDEISHGDKELVKAGAAFYWSIGYADSKTGQRRRESITRFRRLPETVKREIEAAKKEAKRVRNAIGWR